MVHPFVLPFVFIAGAVLGVSLERKSRRRADDALRKMQGGA